MFSTDYQRYRNIECEKELLHTWVQQEVLEQLTWICQACCHVGLDPSHVALREEMPEFCGWPLLSSLLSTRLSNPFLASQNGSERFLREICIPRTVQNGSLSWLGRLSIVADTCRTVVVVVVVVVVVLAPVLPRNVVDVGFAEILQPETCLHSSVCPCRFCVP